MVSSEMTHTTEFQQNSFTGVAALLQSEAGPPLGEGQRAQMAQGD